MIRGLQKQMIQLATPKSEYFEVVFFVLRPTVPREKESETEMVRAAQKILSESVPRIEKARSAHSKRQQWWLFFGGALCGAALCAATVAILVSVF